MLGDEKQALGEKRGLLGTPASLGQGPQLRFLKNPELLEQTGGVKAPEGVDFAARCANHKEAVAPGCQVSSCRVSPKGWDPEEALTALGCSWPRRTPPEDPLHFCLHVCKTIWSLVSQDK